VLEIWWILRCTSSLVSLAAAKGFVNRGSTAKNFTTLLGETMPASGQNNAQDTALGGSSSAPYALDHGAPIIMVEGRKHSVEDRRRVRAQAARASAAASRETRQRNRGDQTSRQASTSRVEAPNPQNQSGPVDLDAASQRPDLHRASTSLPAQPLTAQPTMRQEAEASKMPLTIWLHEWLKSSPSLQAAALEYGRQGRTGAVGSDLFAGQAPYEVALGFEREEARFELPIAVPRGFAELQRSGSINDALGLLVGRTACFNFGGPGAKRRLQALLRDLVLSTGQWSASRSVQRIHEYVRIACVCLTIFQSQRASGQEVVQNPHYQMGLEAAWQEANTLDPGDLQDRSTAQVLLWAGTMVILTCGAPVVSLNPLVPLLCEYLQLETWETQRQLLSTFIYPASFLDARCRQLFEELTYR